MKNTTRENLRASSWSWILKNILMPSGDLLFRQKMMERFSFLEKAQWWDVEQLKFHRNKLLCSTIRIAYEEVPFYRHLMENSRVRPGDIAVPADLSKLPIVTKDMLRKDYPQATVRNTGQRIYETFTSGSTGKNFCVAEDAETAGWYRASFLLALEWAGWTFGEPHLQTGMTIKRGLNKRLKDALLQCYYLSAFDLSDSNLDHGLNALEKHSIKHLWGYPGSLYFLAKRAIEMGWNKPMQTIVTWGDKLHPYYRKTIEQAFKSRICDTYGCAEGMQISAQCGHGEDYHVHMLDAIVEYLNDNGEPVSDEQPGNIVLTRLHPGPMPLIRYQIGDIGIAGTQKACECGRGFELMKTIEGRNADVIFTPTGNRLIVHFFTGILEHFPEIDSFQIVQEEKESIYLLIVPTKVFSASSPERIISALKDKGASDLHIKLDIVADIPLQPSGKHRFVINKLNDSKQNTHL